MSNTYLNGLVQVQTDINKKKVKITFNFLEGNPRYNTDVRKLIVMLSEVCYHFDGVKQVIQDYMPGKRILFIVHSQFQTQVQNIEKLILTDLKKFFEVWGDAEDIKPIINKVQQPKVTYHKGKKEPEKVEAVYP